MKLKVVLSPEAEGGFSASIPALTGCHSQGETREEALANIREAAEGWLAVKAAMGGAPAHALVEEIEI